MRSVASKLIIFLSLFFVTSTKADNARTEKDSNFLIEYSDEGIVSFKQINPSASARDLATFFEELYQKRLSKKIQAGLPLTKADINLLGEVIFGESQAIGAFGQAFLSEILDKYPGMTESEMLSTIQEKAPNGVPDNWKIYIHNLVEFREGKQDPLLRKLIKEYAVYFKPINDECIRGDAYLIAKQMSQTFNNPYVSASILAFNPFESVEKSIERYEDPNLRPYKAIYPNLKDFAINAEEIGERWSQVYSVVSHYIKLLRRIYREVSAYNSVARDQYSRKLLEDFMIKNKKDFVEMIRNSNQVFVDLPFVFLTKYAFVNIQRCKSPLWDDDDAMIAIASVYAISVHGNAMLNDITSSHAANCYVQLIRLLKSELGGDKPGSKFSSFLKQSKLYEIDPSNYRDGDYRSRSDE